MAEMTTPHLPGKFVWFEHVSSDVTKARAFYEPLFGWHVERMPLGDQSYDMLMHDSSGGIGGLTTAQAGERTHWASYLSVPNVDDRFAAATKAGAKPLLPPSDFGPVGRGAAVLDPTGAAVCLWKSARGDRPDLDNDTPNGDWCWNELWTPDAKTALAFYEKVFGYTHDNMDMGPQGTYYILKAGDKPRAGLFQAPDNKTPPMWLPYVKVGDCDASSAKAAQLGAQVVMPPTDIPSVGRFSVFIDPQGAALAVIKLVAPQA